MELRAPFSCRSLQALSLEWKGRCGMGPPDKVFAEDLAVSF